MQIFGIPIFPEQASAFAKDVDALYFFILATCAFFAIGVSVAVVWLGLKYHRTHEGQIGARIEGNLPLELLWSVIPTIIAMFMFGWGASVYYHLRRPPDEALQLYAVGKQWMWKFQHLEGQREINELHIPSGRPWFEAQKPGVYHIFCTEYCGTNHAGMIGSVTVLEPAAYQAWLQGGGEGGTLAERGARLFNDLACNTCHLDSGQGRGPSLKDKLGTMETLQDGSTVLVDEAYLRESILNSQAKIVRGFQPLMPTFQGLISEENLVALIEHVKSLSPQATTTAAPAAAPTAPPTPAAPQRKQ
jgi:cytochrome c oxidase subunit 2